ncbi:MAG: hypothetical protein ACXVE4_14075, partial [Solirubrobacteraceae bacterium]
LGHTFFPSVISGPFSSALTSAFTFGLVACVIAALASLVPAKGQPWFGRGRRSVADEHAADSLIVIPPAARWSAPVPTWSRPTRADPTAAEAQHVADRHHGGVVPVAARRRRGT